VKKIRKEKNCDIHIFIAERRVELVKYSANIDTSVPCTRANNY